MRSRKRGYWIYSGLMAIGIIAMPAYAAPDLPAVSVFADAGSISFAPDYGYTQAQLTVRARDGGIVFERAYAAHEPLRYGLVSSKGRNLSDGRYVYELRFSLPSGRESVASGRFEIGNGALIAAETIEVDVKQDIIDVTTLGDSIVEGSICVSDSTECLFDLILFESESFDTPGFGAADIKIKDNVPEIWFADTTSLDSDFALTVEDGLFFVRDPDADTWPIVVEGGAPSNSLYVSQASGVGIGTATPGYDIDVRNVNDDFATHIHFGVGSAAWTNAIPFSSGNFVFNRQETGGPEFVVTRRFSPGGTLVVHGTVNELSSRTAKTGFAAVDRAEMLAKVDSLPVTSWRYREDRAGALHVGPVAEDFQRVFGLGDGRTIASSDARGIMLAAIQGLKQELDVTRRQLEVRDQRIANLEQRFLRLEQHLAEALP